MTSAADEIRTIVKDSLGRMTSKGAKQHLLLIADRLEGISALLGQELDQVSPDQRMVLPLAKLGRVAVAGLGALSIALVSGSVEGATSEVVGHRLGSIEQEVTAAALACEEADGITYQLRAASGSVIDVGDGVRIGRAPKAAHPTLRAVSIDDPSQTVNRSHIEVRPRVGGVEVTDLNSLNGTSVTLVGRSTMRLQPEEPFLIPPGSRIELASGGGPTYVVEDCHP